MSLQELERALKPWYSSLENPEESQEETLFKLLDIYRKTLYGRKHCANDVSSVREYREKFPVVSYWDLKPYVDRVLKGEYEALLNEPPIVFMMTRGTTGESKVLPVSKFELNYKVEVSARGLLNYVYRRKRFNILSGCDLNLNFPSKVKSFNVCGREVPCGYSSGIYAVYNAEARRIKLVPKQEEIDSLGADLSEEGWRKRFDLVYRRARGERVTMLIGVVQVMVKFASYLKKKYGVYPRDVWRELDVIVASSAPRIQSVYKSKLKAMYGESVSIVEIYGATEGVFAQQLDEKPYVTPNYDKYFLEVLSKGEFKMLYELKKGDYGRLIVSTPSLPRYDIGDIIVCYGENYFRVIGRAKGSITLKYWINKFVEALGF